MTEQLGLGTLQVLQQVGDEVEIVAARVGARDQLEVVDREERRVRQFDDWGDVE